MKRNFLFTLLLIAGLFIVSCKNEPKGDAAQVGNAAEAATTTGVNFTVDTSSIINWEGTKVAGKHMGIIKITNGSFALADGNITSGSFTLDMNSIIVTDLQGDAKADLEAHLKGTEAEGADHFFDVKKFPTAQFDVTKVTKLTNDAEATHLVYGNLNLKGVTKEVGFKAKVDEASDMIKITTPSFTINRTDFGIKYGSATFFDDLKDKAINDNIGLQLNLSANKG